MEKSKTLFAYEAVKKNPREECLPDLNENDEGVLDLIWAKVGVMAKEAVRENSKSQHAAKHKPKTFAVEKAAP